MSICLFSLLGLQGQLFSDISDGSDTGKDPHSRSIKIEQRADQEHNHFMRALSGQGIEAMSTILNPKDVIQKSHLQDITVIS